MNAIHQTGMSQSLVSPPRPLKQSHFTSHQSYAAVHLDIGSVCARISLSWSQSRGRSPQAVAWTAWRETAARSQAGSRIVQAGRAASTGRFPGRQSVGGRRNRIALTKANSGGFWTLSAPDRRRVLRPVRPTSSRVVTWIDTSLPLMGQSDET
jgi:hypothetical protein